jgi:ubiquinone/menaquinone biosynthesis C-methylase UbiE
MKADHEFRHGWIVRAYLWATRLLYGPLAWAYDTVAWLVSFGYWSRWRLDALGYLQAGSVLETGFGTGALLVALAEGGFDVTGLEPSPQMLKVTDRKLRRKKLLIKRVGGKTEAIPFMADWYDNVLSTFPSNYILEEQTLREIYRVMDRDGRWVVVGMGVRHKSGIVRFILNLWMGRYMDVFIQQFIEFAESSGFKARRVDHQTDAYTLPVLILEKRDGT